MNTPSEVLRLEDQRQMSSYEFQESSQRCKPVSAGRWVLNGALMWKQCFSQVIKNRFDKWFLLPQIRKKEDGEQLHAGVENTDLKKKK